MANPDKWRFAIGTTSRVPDMPEYHYLILDYDYRSIPMSVWGIGVSQSTNRGWHVYTPIVYTQFKDAIQAAKKLGADPVWLRIGEKRGYLFLADKAPVPLPWPVERMVIARETIHRSNFTGVPSQRSRKMFSV